MKRQIFLYLLASVPVLLPLSSAMALGSPDSAPSCTRGGPDQSPLIVFSDRGAVSTIRADGRQYCRLTSFVALRARASPPGYGITIGAASSPALSPAGLQIAYLTTTTQNSHDVWIVRAGGTARGPQRVNTPSDAVDREMPTWSPGGRYLTYYQGKPVGTGSPDSYAGLTVMIVPVAVAPALPVSHVKFALRGTPNAFGFGEGPPLAWSPDGKKIASIVGFVPGRTTASYPVGLNVGVADVRTGRTRTITIRFPAGVLGPDPGPGSFPTGTDLAWTADSGQLIVSTLGRGAGGTLSGLWRVSDRGGVAQLFVGTRADIREHVPASPQVDGGTTFLMSPNHRLLATNPDNRFWVADARGAHGVFIHTEIKRSCVLAQSAWLVDSSGLAYITACALPRSQSVRLSLYSVELGGRPRLLVQLISSQQDAMGLSDARRCLGCA